MCNLAFRVTLAVVLSIPELVQIQSHACLARALEGRDIQVDENGTHVVLHCCGCTAVPFCRKQAEMQSIANMIKSLLHTLC